jgi:hypothetical protein
MRLRHLPGRFGFGLMAVVGTVMLTLLVGLAGATPPPCSTSAGVTTCTYSYTGAEQPFTVPAGVSSVHVVAVGAAGGSSASSIPGGKGARVSGDVSVTPGQTLYVEVGGTPASDASFCWGTTTCIGGLERRRQRRGRAVFSW